MNNAKPINLDINYIVKRLMMRGNSPEEVTVSDLRRGFVKAYAVPRVKQIPLQALLALKQYKSSKKDIYDQMTLCKRLYKYESVLSTAIDIMVELAITEIYVDNLEGNAKVLVDFWKKNVNIENKNADASLGALLERIANEALIRGNVFPYCIWRKFDIGGTSYQLPMDVPLLNPMDIEIPEDSVSLVDKKILFKLQSDVAQALKRQGVSRNERDKELIKSIPKQLIKNIDPKTGKLDLDHRFVYHIKRKAQDYEIWGKPFLLRTLSVLNRLKSLENLDQDTLDGIINRMIFLKAGDPSDPRQDDIDNVKAVVANPTQSMLVVTGPHLEKIEVSSDSALVNLADRYTEIREHLFDALGIPVNLFSGRFTSQGERDTIAVLALQKRLNKLRSQILLWVNRTINQILFVNGFENITPAVNWSKLNLQDPDTLREYVTTFADRGWISLQTALREADYDIETERVLRQAEDARGDNKTFMIRAMPSTTKGIDLLQLTGMFDGNKNGDNGNGEKKQITKPDNKKEIVKKTEPAKPIKPAKKEDEIKIKDGE